MNRFRLTPGARLAVIAACTFLFNGCATNPSAPASGQALFVEGEVVQQTGSRISHVVKKGGPAGTADDRPGATVGAAMIVHEQNDILPQFGPK